MNQCKIIIKICHIFLVLITCYGLTCAQQQEYYYKYSQKTYVTVKQNEYVLKFKQGITDEQVQGFFSQNPSVKIQNNCFYHCFHIICNNPLNINQNPIVGYLTSIYVDQYGVDLLMNDQLIFAPKKDINKSQIISLMAQFSLTEYSEKQTCYIVKTNSSQSQITLSHQLFESNLLKYCQPDFFVQIEPTSIPPDDEYFNNQFYLKNTGQLTNSGFYATPGADIQISDAWGLSKGSGIKIAIIDDGIMQNHYDLQYQRQVRLNGSNIIWENSNSDPNDPSPDLCQSSSTYCAHGQACAGIASASTNNTEGISGIAYEAVIMPIKLFKYNLYWIETSKVILAYEFAFSNGADIISNSYGITTQSSFEAVENTIMYITSFGRNGKGCLFIASAGNTRCLSNFPNCDGIGFVVYPAAFDINDIFVVGSSNRNDNISMYSPINEKIDFCATSDHAKPWQCDTCALTEAGEIYSLDLPGAYGFNPNWDAIPFAGNHYMDYYGCFGGTSASCAMVAGVSALILSANPDITDDEVQFILKYSADKVGGYNYIWNPDKPGHSKELGYGRINAYNAVKLALGQIPVGDITITDNLEWNSNWMLNGNLTIKANATLTIKSEVQFSSEKKIIIERGAKLIVDGGVLKGACGNTWQGIELWGNKSQKQLATTQGTVELKNGATIEDAVVAIQTYKPGSRSYSGGIVFAEDAIFRNNQTDVLFEQYANIAAGTEYANLSYFKSCVFETTDDCLFETVRGHARLMAVNGIKFYGCSFDDRRTRIDVLRNGAKGIDASLSGFMVDNHPVTNQPCEFNNLLYGVYSSGLSNPARFSVSVRQAVFASWRGVYLRDITAAIAELNLFSVPVYNVRADASDYRYGLYLDACNTYTVQENQFASDAHQLSPLVGSSFGLVVNSSGAFANQLYKNTFVGFGVASEAIGINNGLDNGLQFKCNDYTNGQYDIYVYGSASTVAASQGSLTDPANNLFSNGGPILVSDLENDGNFITYYHADPLTNSRVKPLIYTTNKVTLVNTLLPNNSNSCPSQITGISYSFGQIKTEQQQVNAIKSFLEGKVDKGNTFDLEMDIVMANESTAYPAYINLMQTAPYVSENVLEELGGQEYAFANTMIRDVMIANPHAAKSEKIMEKLGERVNSLPEYMLNQIRHGKNIISQFENYKAELLNKKITLNKMVAQYQKSLINKDSTDNSNEILNIYSQLDDPMFKITWAKILIGEGNFETALDILSDAFNLADEKDKPYFQAIQEFYINYTQWLTEGQSIDSLGNDAILWLKNIPADHPAYPMAITLLSINDPIVYQEALLLPEPGQLKSAKTTDHLENKQFEFLAYPNPANQQVTIMYDFNSYTDLSFQVSDITGRVVFREKLQSNCSAFLLDVSLFQNGLYYCSIIAGRSSLETIPLNIIR